MNQKIRRSISIMLAVVMVLTAMPAFALAESKTMDVCAQNTEKVSGNVDPVRVNEAVTNFTNAVSQFVANTSEMSKFASFLTRFGGVTSLASGVMGFLQISGITQDPVLAALGNIQTTLKDVQTQISNMDTKIDGISQQLDTIAFRQEEIDRNDDAKEMLTNWNNFCTYYTEPLDAMMKIYQAKIEDGISDWLDDPSEYVKSLRGGVYVLYTKVTSESGESLALTYSSKSFGNGLPEQADNGETVDVLSYGVPAKYLPTEIRYDPDKFRPVFETQMAANFIKAADAHELTDADAFYVIWDGLNDASKEEKAALYASDILNTVIYHIACVEMTKNNQWVTEVINKYNNYCNNVLKQNSGVDAFLNAMYLTHGFEGEIRDDIESFCDGMIAQAGVYGEFALTCAGQDGRMHLTDKQDIQEMFINTVNRLAEKKDLSITGHDNYCYLTGNLVEVSTIKATSSITVKVKGGTPFAFVSATSTNWDITVPNMMDSVYTQVLYNLYKTQNHDNSSFAEYLRANGANRQKYNGIIMTKYVGAQIFSLNEGIRMQANYINSGSDYFDNGKWYNINTNTSSKVEDEYFQIHDKVVCDTFNMTKGVLAENQTAGARALYGENHALWITDEVWELHTDGMEVDWSSYDYKLRHVYTYSLPLTVLKQTPIHNLNGDYDDDNDPFMAFDRVTLVPGVSDVIGPIYESNKAQKTLTSVKLASASYTYTGKDIKPEITVKAGKYTVPSGWRTVSYLDNKGVGYGTVIVDGEGYRYMGTISKTFTIRPKGSSVTSVKKRKTTATVKWKKQSEKMPDTRITGYQIRYSTKSSMKNAKKITVKGYKNTSKTIKGLKKNTKYYFQIRTYFKTGKGDIYSKWSRKKAS